MSICKNIEIQIKETETIIRRHLKITDSQWEGKPKSMIDSIKKIKDRDLKAIKENYLTFILASAYAYIGKEGCYSLQQKLCENMLPPYTEQSLVCLIYPLNFLPLSIALSVYHWDDVHRYFPQEVIEQYRKKIIEEWKSGKFKDREIWEPWNE